MLWCIACVLALVTGYALGRLARKEREHEVVSKGITTYLAQIKTLESTQHEIATVPTTNNSTLEVGKFETIDNHGIQIVRHVR